MADKITVIKVLGANEDFIPNRADIERWHQIFAEEKMTVQEAVATGEIEAEVLPEKKEGQHYLTLVRVGGDDYMPTFEDLEVWKTVFEDAKGDPDFKIFTHPNIDITVIDIGKIVAIE